MVDAGYLDLPTCQQEARAPIHLSTGKTAGAGPWRAPFFVSEVSTSTTCPRCGICLCTTHGYQLDGPCS